MKVFQSSIFRAACAVIIGVLILKFPQEGITWLTMAVGALFLLSGAIALIAYWQAQRHAADYTIIDKEGRVVSGAQPTFPIVGAGSIILGLTLIISPTTFVNGLMYVIGGVLILGGLNQLMNLVAARRLGNIPFLFWVCPSLIMLTGVFVLLKPMDTAELPLIILGWCALLYGVTEIINSLKIWNIRKQSNQKIARQQADNEQPIAEEISSELGTDEAKDTSNNTASDVGDDTLNVGLEDMDTRPVVPAPRDN